MKDKKTIILIVALALCLVLLAGLLVYMQMQPGGINGVMVRAGERIAYAISPTPSPSPTPEPTPTPTPEPTPDPEVVALEELRERQSSEEEFLTLVNAWNPLDENYVPEVETVTINWQYEIQADVRCADALQEMFYACQDAGNQPYILSSYRDYWTQYELYQNKIIRCEVEDGVSEEAAPAVAAMSVAPPGTSEHELGLAFDINDMEYTELDEGQEQTSTQQWLMTNCWKYGFILRYPNGTSEITGIIYEPWHYRYVGKIAAKEIHERGITLEEYLDLLYPGKYASADITE